MAEYNDSGGVILDGPFDPDAQATVTDFIDYTEYLPADLIRSLTLIRGLDKRYLDSTQRVHELTRSYGQLPDLPPDSRPDPCVLRRDISAHLDSAINAREAAYAEACRAYDVIDRHFNRLDAIRKKLDALPKPVSREPTPPAQPVANAKRPRTSRKADDAATTTTRITLRLDGVRGGPAQKSRTRRSVVAAEHLAGLHPDSPIASTEHSDLETETKPTATQPKKEKQTRRSRPSGEVTNTQPRASAGMSTSSALALLKPPPEDAKPGSEDLPWLRLTEWEMTKLRKKMKKNAVWQPSEVMIHRELALRGRGWEAYRAAKAEAEANGTEFIDCDDIMNNYIPGLLTRRSEATKELLEGVAEPKLSNRGMKLNEAKKLKRENQAREQAALAAAEAEAAKRLGQIGSTSQGLNNGADRPQDSSAVAGKPSRALKKRKLEASGSTAAAPDAPPADGEIRSSLRSSTKRRKMGQESPPMDTAASTTAATAGSVPEASVGSPESQKQLPVPASSVPPLTAAAIGSRGVNTPTPPRSRQSSRRRSITGAEQPGLHVVGTGRELRRKSATPARRTPGAEATRTASAGAPPTRRQKRPAPGPVSSGRDGGAAVSYGRREAKPGKKRVMPRDQSKDGAMGQDIRIDEDGVLEEIDPNEPRYCLCGDVSFGTMICCENQDCDREWFHLDCVGLSEVPSRTAKWYCPECRVKFKKGPDGIIRNSSSRR